MTPDEARTRSLEAMQRNAEAESKRNKRRDGQRRVVADIWKSPCGRMEIRLGRWQDVLADVTECDAVIVDPPFSETTHTGALDATTLERGVSYNSLPPEEATAWAMTWCARS